LLFYGDCVANPVWTTSGLVHDPAAHLITWTLIGAVVGGFLVGLERSLRTHSSLELDGFVVRGIHRPVCICSGRLGSARLPPTIAGLGLGGEFGKLLRPDQLCASCRPRGPEAMAIACPAHHLSWATSKTRRRHGYVAAMEPKMTPLFWFMWLNETAAFTASALLSCSPLRRPRRPPVLRVIEGGRRPDGPRLLKLSHISVIRQVAVNAAQTFECPRPVENLTSYQRSRQHSPTSRKDR